MKLPRLSLLAAAALCCTAFAISCESDDPRNAIAPFWTDGDVDGDGLNGGKGQIGTVAVDVSVNPERSDGVAGIVGFTGNGECGAGQRRHGENGKTG